MCVVTVDGMEVASMCLVPCKNLINFLSTARMMLPSGVN